MNAFPSKVPRAGRPFTVALPPLASGNVCSVLDAPKEGADCALCILAKTWCLMLSSSNGQMSSCWIVPVCHAALHKGFMLFVRRQLY